MALKETLRLSPAALYRRVDLELLDFATTDDLETITEVVGQPRAMQAMKFGVDMARQGYNLFALGPAGLAKRRLVQQFFEAHAAQQPTPPDWCYVHDFEHPHRPRALELPPGMGQGFRKDMEDLVRELQTTLPTAYEGADYQARRQALEQELEERQAAALNEFQERAQKESLALIRTPDGLAIAPVKDDAVLSPEQLEALPATEQSHIQEQLEQLQGELQKILRQAPAWQHELREKLTALNHEIATLTVGGLIDALQAKYAAHPGVVEHLDAVQKDVVENAEDFLAPTDGEAAAAQQLVAQMAGPPALQRYKVNVLVDNATTQGAGAQGGALGAQGGALGTQGAQGAPVIFADNPTYENLVGRVEQRAQLGALFTDFTLINAGALHKANGGYLILDARTLLLQTYGWEGLKRALRAQEIRIESLAQVLNSASTVSLEPAPIPLNVKVALLGERSLYYLLLEEDPDFAELFKVAADFDEEMDRDAGSEQLYARLLATLIRKEQLQPFSREAVARVIEHSARMVGDAEKLSARMQNVTDLLRESDYWAREAAQAVVTALHVQQAIDAQEYRADRARERALEDIQRQTLLIETAGEVVGQLNGLAVLQVGDFAFGKPGRITARVTRGEGQVVDIEREVDLGGPLHSKGVLILAGFLKGRYAVDAPLSLSASLVFEQSYGGVDGDSASSAELYALLSAIAGVGIKQSLAVTGSVDQRGQIQPIGGVNEKIEGFFDVCAARGLTGEQGVLIPASNVQHLMLRRDVVEAVEGGRFHIYAVKTVDEGIELLTGLPAGERDEAGEYPEGSLNALVAGRLRALAEKQRAQSKSQDEESAT